MINEKYSEECTFKVNTGMATHSFYDEERNNRIRIEYAKTVADDLREAHCIDFYPMLFSQMIKYLDQLEYEKRNDVDVEIEFVVSKKIGLFSFSFRLI